MAAAIQVSRAHLSRLAHHASGLQKRLHRVSAKAEHAFDVGISAAIGVGLASGIGLIHGRHGAIEVAGVPLELGLGAAGIIGGLIGVGGKHADKIGAAGTSLLGIYGYNMAKGAGLKMKAKAAGGTPEKTTGRLPQDSLKREEIETMDRPTVAERHAA